MEPEQLMGSAARLVPSVEALAALAAYVRVESEGLEIEPEVHELLRAISVAVTDGDPREAGPAAMPVVGMARFLFAHAAELVAEPARRRPTSSPAS
jgi:hypothetical protein